MNVRDVWHYPGRRFPEKVRYEHYSDHDRPNAALVVVQILIVQSCYHLRLRNVGHRRMDFVSLGGLRHHRNHRLNGGTPWLMALQLANRNRYIRRQCQGFIRPSFKLLDSGGVSGWTRLLEKVHGLEQKRENNDK
jgi:hypothetical protein